MNTIIIISLLAIGIAAFLGYAIGVRNGIKEGREETIKRFVKVTARQMQRLMYGGVYSKN